jgi:hypothetical protein
MMGSTVKKRISTGMGRKIISGRSATQPHYKPRFDGYQKKPETPALMDKNKLSAGITKQGCEHDRGYEPVRGKPAPGTAKHPTPG